MVDPDLELREGERAVFLSIAFLPAFLPSVILFGFFFFFLIKGVSF